MNLSNKLKFLIELSNTLAKSKRPIVYIAGKVTGLPMQEYTSKFAATTKKLQDDGWQVLNPIDFVPPGTGWEEAMRISMPLLCMADTIYLQRDWQDSKGAHIEWATAIKLGLTCIYE